AEGPRRGRDRDRGQPRRELTGAPDAAGPRTVLARAPSTLPERPTELSGYCIGLRIRMSVWPVATVGFTSELGVCAGVGSGCAGVGSGCARASTTTTTHNAAPRATPGFRCEASHVGVCELSREYFDGRCPPGIGGRARVGDVGALALLSKRSIPVVRTVLHRRYPVA